MRRTDATSEHPVRSKYWVGILFLTAVLGFTASADPQKPVERPDLRYLFETDESERDLRPSESSTGDEDPAIPEALTVSLNDTGIATLGFLNPRDPPKIVEDDLGKTALVFRNDGFGRTLVVDIEVPDRKFPLVPILQDLLSEDQLGDAEEVMARETEWTAGSDWEDLSIDEKEEKLREGLDRFVNSDLPSDATSEFDFSNCKGEKQTCTATSLLNPGDTAILKASRLEANDDINTGDAGSDAALTANPCILTRDCYDPVGLHKFTVRFFDSTELVPNATGYFGIVRDLNDSVAELPGKIGLVGINASVGWNQDPDPQVVAEGENKGDPKPFSLDDPYTGDSRTRFPGSGLMKLGANLGSRADASLSLQFKEKDLGAQDQSGDVKATQYQVRAYSRNGLILRFGKLTFLQPSSGLAMRVSGEGFELYKYSSRIGYLVERESEDGTADRQDRDRWLTYVSADLLEILRRREGRQSTFAPFTSIEVHGLYGEEQGATDKAGGPFEHWTAGAHANFWLPIGDADRRDADGDRNGERENRYTAGGSLAAYWSERKADSEAKVKDGKGNTYLGSLVFNKVHVQPSGLKKPKRRWTVLLVAGYGSGDDSATETVDEGFMGETARFRPDTIFLRSLASSTDASDELPSGVEGGQVGANLSNKTYGSISATTYRWSLFDFLLLPFDEMKKDITDSQTTVSYHHYDFNEEVFGSRDAGEEWSLDFKVQVPKGVTVNLGVALFEPGAALQEIYQDEVWQFNSGVSVAIKP